MPHSVHLYSRIVGIYKDGLPSFDVMFCKAVVGEIGKYVGESRWVNRVKRLGEAVKGQQSHLNRSG